MHAKIWIWHKSREYEPNIISTKLQIGLEFALFSEYFNNIALTNFFLQCAIFCVLR